MDIFITVVVIAYNNQEYIEECLISIQRQTLKEFEVIFVNDGSTDNTVRKAKNVINKDNRMRLINKENGGIISARKCGVKEAKGNYIVFVDGDDYLNQDMLQKLYNIIKNDNDLDIVTTNLLIENELGEFVIQKNYCEDGIYDGDKYLKLIMEDKIIHNMFPKIYKKDFLIRAKYLEYPDINMAEDLLTNAQLGIFNPRVKVVSDSNYYYRKSKTSMTRGNDRRKVLEQEKTYYLMKKFFKNMGLYDKYKEYFEFQWLSYMYNYILSDISFNIKRDILKIVSNKLNINNKICKEFFNRNRKYNNIRVQIYLHNSYIGEIFNNAFLLIKYIIKFVFKFKNNNFIKKSIKKIYFSIQTYNLNKKFRNKKNVINLIGTSDRCNIGDHTIAKAERKFFNKYFSDFYVREITGDHFRYEQKNIKKMIQEQQLIIITGGGFLGNLWMNEELMVRNIINMFPQNPIFILPQTIYFEENKNKDIEYNNSKNFYLKNDKIFISARDMESYKLLCKMIGKEKCGLYPDMALFYQGKNKLFKDKNNTVLLCFRGDKESILTQEIKDRINKKLYSLNLKKMYISTCDKNDIILRNRNKKIKNKIMEFSEAKILVTDRLHGMILSAIAGTPCIAFDNSSKKISGVYNLWLKDLDYIKFVNNYEEFEIEFENLIKMNNIKYNNKYLKIYYDNLANCIRNFIEKED